MNTRKRLLTIVLCFVMVLTSIQLPILTSAANIAASESKTFKDDFETEDSLNNWDLYATFQGQDGLAITKNIALEMGSSYIETNVATQTSTWPNTSVPEQDEHVLVVSPSVKANTFADYYATENDNTTGNAEYNTYVYDAVTMISPKVLKTASTEFTSATFDMCMNIEDTRGRNQLYFGYSEQNDGSASWNMLTIYSTNNAIRLYEYYIEQDVTGNRTVTPGSVGFYLQSEQSGISSGYLSEIKDKINWTEYDGAKDGQKYFSTKTQWFTMNVSYNDAGNMVLTISTTSNATTDGSTVNLNKKLYTSYKPVAAEDRMIGFGSVVPSTYNNAYKSGTSNPFVINNFSMNYVKHYTPEDFRNAYADVVQYPIGLDGNEDELNGKLARIEEALNAYQELTEELQEQLKEDYLVLQKNKALVIGAKGMWTDNFETEESLNDWDLYATFQGQDGKEIVKNIEIGNDSGYVDRDDYKTWINSSVPNQGENVLVVNPSVDAETFADYYATEDDTTTGNAEYNTYVYDAVTMISPKVLKTAATEFTSATFDMYMHTEDLKGRNQLYFGYSEQNDGSASWNMLTIYTTNNKIYVHEYFVSQDVNGKRTVTPTSNNLYVGANGNASGAGYSSLLGDKVDKINWDGFDGNRTNVTKGFFQARQQWFTMSVSYNDSGNMVLKISTTSTATTDNSEISFETALYTSQKTVAAEDRMIGFGSVVPSTYNNAYKSGTSNPFVINNFSMTFKGIEPEKLVRVYTNSVVNLAEATWTGDFEAVSNIEDANVVVYRPESESTDAIQSELDVYLQANSNIQKFILVNDVQNSETASKILKYATDNSVPYIDMYAYGEGTDKAQVIANAVMTIQVSAAVDGTLETFNYNASKMNPHLTPTLYSATIRNSGDAESQNLGFTTKKPEKVRTGGTVVETGTIFAYYPSSTSGVTVDDVLASMTYENAIDTNNTDVIYAEASISDDSFTAGVSATNNINIAYKYIARSYVKYEDGTVYYSVNTRSDKENSYANSIGVLEGYAVRSVMSVAKEMIKTLYVKAQDSDDAAFKSATSQVVIGVTDGVIQWAEGVTEAPDQIFTYICDYKAQVQ